MTWNVQMDIDTMIDETKKLRLIGIMTGELTYEDSF